METLESLNQFLARQIINKSHKRFSTLFADYQEQQMSNSGSINDSNRIGNSADGFNSKTDVTNPGSMLPEGVVAQSNRNSTSPVTSGATASSQVSPLAVKNVGARPLVGSHADSKIENEGADFNTASLHTQKGPRGETSADPNAGG